MSLNNESELKVGTKNSYINDIFGNPKKSIFKLSKPIIIVLLFGAVNNIVDLIWVSGLGVDALSAVGFCIPINMIVLALSGGLGAGGGALISQRIGAKDKTGADSYAAHTIVLMVITALLFSGLIILFIRPLLIIIGAGDLVEMTLSYARILFSGIIIFFFNDVACSILESEGNVKLATRAIAIGVALNIIFDPIFIYVLNLGVAGAAMASLLGGFFANIILFNWLFIKKKTYVTITFKNFLLKKKQVTDILKLSLPISIAGLSLSVLIFIMNIIVIKIGGTDGVAVFSTGMRIVFISLLPMMGITPAVTTMVGVAYGNKDFVKINLINTIGIKIGLIIEGFIAVTTFVLAPHIAGLFIWSSASARIENDLTLFLRIMACLYLSAPFARASMATFIGSGKSQYAMAVALMQTLIVIPPFTYFCGKFLEIGLSGIWIGLVAGNWIVALMTFIWAKMYIRRLYYQKGMV
jgi:putative MATE family efflux protein